jgi:signal transduction histidine kinase
MDEFSAELEMCEFDLSKAVREAADPFSGMAEFSGKSLDLSVPGGIRFYGNEPAMKRLVSVLLDNAVKYSPEGDWIRLVLSREGKKTVLLTENRIDSPLPEETVSRLFDRFYRPDASRARDGSGGSGIGLSIARAITEKHGGQIHVRQNRNGSILFRAEFPGRVRVPAVNAPEST